MTMLSQRPVRSTHPSSTLRSPGLDWLLMVAALALVLLQNIHLRSSGWGRKRLLG